MLNLYAMIAQSSWQIENFGYDSNKLLKTRNFSSSALRHTKNTVNLNYFGTACLLNFFFASRSPQDPLILISLSNSVILMLFTLCWPKIRAVNL